MLKGRLWEQYRRLLQPQRLGNGVGEGDVSGEGGQSSSDPAIRELAQKIVLVSLFSLARARALSLSLCMFLCVYIYLASSSMLSLLQDE